MIDILYPVVHIFPKGFDMRRIALIVFVSILSVVLASCVTQTDPNDIRGVWKAEADGEEYMFSFTSDGFYAFEHSWDGYRDYVDFGSYQVDFDETGEGTIITDSSDYYCFRDGKYLVIDYYGTEISLTRTSRTAKNNTSASNLKGVWSDGISVTGFSLRGVVLTMGATLGMQDYSADETNVMIDGSECPYLIINNRLYIYDDNGFLGAWTCTVLERKTSGGNEQTSRDILVNYSPWHLTDTGDGTSHYIYTFTSTGRYNMEYYYEGYSDRSTSSGSYTYSGNNIELSDDADLAYAIIDNVPFMFTY